MLSQHIWALVAKDLRLHGRSIIVAQSGIILLGLGAVASRSFKTDGSTVALLFNLNFLLAGFWGDWLVSREKLKGTIAWLRSLPLSDSEVVTSKFVAHALCAVSLWAVSTLLLARHYFFPHRVASWTILLLILVAFGGLSIGCRWRFHQKVGQVIPFGFVAVLVGAFLGVKRVGYDLRAQLEGAWGQGFAQFGIALLLLFLYYLAWRMTVVWMRNSDTADLLE